MVMDLLGPSLEELLDFCNRRFSLKTILMLAEQMIQTIEYIHYNNFICRNINPGNFLIGSGNLLNQIFITGLGYSKRYFQRDGTHIPYREDKSLVGTPRYVSLNMHIGIEPSRRDDLISLFYCLIYFLKGSLPWQGLKIGRRNEMFVKKLNTPIQELCLGFPNEFIEYYNYVGKLSFEEKPDYSYCQSLFRQCFQKMGYEKDSNFDWIIIVNERKQQQDKNSVAKFRNNILDTNHQKIKKFFNLI
ncbi:casein kinase I (macronuclear) [Tetrahymena thermophila SB210]|uniref:Casein kinase I n=1 Tax=Tetrahymena thermophila (strain SB210) TaxID=312017 RepID=Q23QG4_TETTS|nr:casein kinase I [Tetrahymena thermophila SB210]EAR98924.2 casein kinase I [Tetrahymena thermophila SB210]|eukprot:XP_001019169.2 casein kinase I [Tetrahymena thermophila SB210]